MTRLGRGIGLGRVLGVPVRVDLSWFAGLALVVFFGRELWAPASPGAAGDPAAGGPAAVGEGAAVLLSLAFALAFFASILVHELAHALVARALGVPTAEIKLFLFGGVARIVGEPADAGGEALLAMAGPLASVTLAGLLALAGQVAVGTAGDLLAWLFLGNLVVAAFNLLPGFPLDGGRVARALVWRLSGRRLLATRLTAGLGRLLAGVLVAGGAGAALWQQSPRWLLHVALGLFLWQAAAEGERSAAHREALAGWAERG